MSATLSREDQARIAEAIRMSESRTSGEIVCVLAETAAIQATALPVMLAAVTALVLPWLLLATTRLSVQAMLSLQGAAFLAALALGCMPVVRRLLTPPAVRRALAWRLAAEQFVVRGLARTADRNGILIFVSRAERYARIIADEGIARHVPQAQWQTAVDALVEHMRQDRPADGFIAAIAICSDVLARRFPAREGASNVLPDRVYQI